MAQSKDCSQCPVLQSRNNRKRSLSTAFRENINLGEPLKKKAKRATNTQFIIGCDDNKQSFYVSDQVFSTLSESLRNMIEINKNHNNNDKIIIHIKDIKPSTFEYIIKYVKYMNNSHIINSIKPKLKFTEIIDILYFANKYDINVLIEECKEKLIKIDGNINNWYIVMQSFEKYKNYESMNEFIAYFIKHNKFIDINDIISDIRFYGLSIDSVQEYVKNTEFNREEMKFVMIYQYLHRNKSHNKPIHETMHKYFMQLIDIKKLSIFNKLNSLNLKNTNNKLTKIEVLNILIDQFSNTHSVNSRINNYLIVENPEFNKTGNRPRPKKGNQGNSRKRNQCKQHKNRKCQQLVLESDKKLEKIFCNNGFFDCNKMEVTGQGTVWRAKSIKYGSIQSVVIKVALQIYCNNNKNINNHNHNHNDNNNNDQILDENIMKEANILRQLNKTDTTQGIINLIDVIEEKEYYMMVLEDGGKEDLFHFVSSIHEKIKNGKIKIEDWQFTLKLIAYKLSNIVCWLHSQNICHLDLSLENVLISSVKWINDKQFIKLCPEFTLKICDFGAAQFIVNDNKSFQSNSRIGKPAFLSPQIFCKQQFDGKKADCWSFGVILWSLIIGGYPWQSPDHEKNLLFQTIVLEKNMDRVLSGWKRKHYMEQSMQVLLNKIFIINQDDRISMEEIRNHLQ